MTENKYAKALKARKEASRDRQERLEAEFAERERRLDERERAIHWKAEFAYEVLRAILPDLRAGRPVAWSRLSQAGENLRDVIPTGIREFLQAETVLDLEERKETPDKPA